MATVTMTLTGDDELRRKLRPERLLGRPARRFLTRGAIVVQGGARELAPVDTGRLRGSIAYEIDQAAVPLWARVGTNVDYAPYQEFGTGAGHFPPPDALEGWGQRHGFPPGSGFVIARSISKRGLRPKRYLRGGLERSQGRIAALLPVLAAEIEAEAAS